MKKIYLLSLLSWLGFAASAQTTVTIYATALSGTYITGNSTATVRTDGTMTTNGTTQRGYAVFDLSSIPAGSTISTATIGTYILSILGAGAPTGTNIYGFAGDLSTVTTPATLYADMVAGTSLSTTAYPTVTGNFTIASSLALTNFLQSVVGGKTSICFTGGSPRTYNMSGETGGLSTVAFNHAPYITITYCPPPTAVTASAAPNPICQGSVLTLTGGATGATGGYTWTGPGPFTSTGAAGSTTTSTLTATLASGGVYTLTAIASCVTFSATATATTAIVTVNPLPGAISGPAALCTGSATTFTSTPLGGNWTSSNTSVAAIGLTTGIATGASSGTATISYTLPSTGCYVTTPLTVNDAPTAITGPSQVCVSSTINLLDGTAGGTWSSNLPGTASVVPATGVVSGVTPGNAVISYVTAGCSSVSYNVTVNPLPNNIFGFSTVCVGSTTNLFESTGGGTWSSSSGITAMVGSTGIVTGMSAGTVNIIYTVTSTGCQAIKAMTVNPLPSAIGGPTDVCVGGTIIATDGSGGGSFSGGAPNASVTGGGTVTGISAGAATITYTLLTGCAITESIAVDPSPSAITGGLVLCQGSTTTLSDPDIGGSWTSMATGVATIGSLSGVVTGVSGGNATISYTYPSGCAAVAIVTVNAQPTATITASGPTTFCAGNSVVLSATIGAGYTYQWNVGGTPIPGATTATYTASASGSYTVDITNTLGCTGVSAATVVTAGFTASITNSTSLNFCVGQNVVLTANSGSITGSLLYQWLYNGAAITSATSMTYAATASGIYRCVVSISGGSGSCTDTTAPVTVVVNALPAPSIILSGTMLATVGSYHSYQWYLNGVGIPGATSATYTPIANGLYRVRAGDAIGCAGYSNQIQITGVGVPMVNMEGTEIYPNPAADMVHIKAPQTVRAVISSMEGKTLIDESDAKDISIKSLADGLYIITLYDVNGTRVMMQKLVKG